VESISRKPIRDRVRAARLRRGLSQGEAAAAVGCTRETLNRWEAGDPAYPGHELAYRLARLLRVRVSVDDIFAAPPGDSS
jgi:DNA-binding XRE family transcriptional regulator